MIDLALLQNIGRAALVHNDINPEIQHYYSLAAQETKQLVTYSIISGKPFEFFQRNVFRGGGIVEAYNFYAETNVQRLKVFIENFLIQANKLSPLPSHRDNSVSEAFTQRTVTKALSEGHINQNFKIISEQLQELKLCLKHFTSSMTAINEAEARNFADSEDLKSNLKMHRFKSNKQALFLECEELVLFTTDIIKNLEILDFDINRLFKTSNTAEGLALDTQDGKTTHRSHRLGTNLLTKSFNDNTLNLIHTARRC